MSRRGRTREKGQLVGGRGTATIRRRGRATIGVKGEEKKEDLQMVCKRGIRKRKERWEKPRNGVVKRTG